MSVNQRLKIVFKDSHLTQDEFANKIGISRGMLSKYLSDENKPGIDVVQKIIEEFNIDAKWLVTGKETGNQVNTFGNENKYGKISFGNMQVNEGQAEYINSMLAAKDREIQALKEVIKAKDELIEALKRK
jgi:transcriptional regulator with XRE-family HTH domain